MLPVPQQLASLPRFTGFLHTSGFPANDLHGTRFITHVSFPGFTEFLHAGLVSTSDFNGTRPTIINALEWADEDRLTHPALSGPCAHTISRPGTPASQGAAPGNAGVGNTNTRGRIPPVNPYAFQSLTQTHPQRAHILPHSPRPRPRECRDDVRDNLW